MTFYTTLENRRSRYDLTADNPISDGQLQHLLEHSLKHAPSAFHSESSRIVLLKGEEHKALWEITAQALRRIVPADKFQPTQIKLNSFAAAQGTILFFEDQDTVKALQEKFTTYADKFQNWSEQHSGILQFIVWGSLAEAGVGANLQHYNPLIDDQVRERWSLPQSWKLIAQMPFGASSIQPGAKEFLPMEQRLRVFGA